MNEWRERAACNKHPSELFDIEVWVKRVLEEGPEERLLEVDERAGMVCDSCPVARECASAALAPVAWHTVRGGIPLIQLNPRARSQLMLKALKQVAAGLPTDHARAAMLTGLRGMLKPPAPRKNKGGGPRV